MLSSEVWRGGGAAQRELERILFFVIVVRVRVASFAPSWRKENDAPFFSYNLTSLSLSPNKKKQAIQSAEDTALNAYSAFKNLQLGEDGKLMWWHLIFFPPFLLRLALAPSKKNSQP